MGKMPTYKLTKMKDIESDLIACKKAFAEACIPWSITDGLVLGYARYKDIMSWDTDLDIGIFIELDSSMWQRLHGALKANGFNLPDRKTDFMHCNRDSEFGMGFFHKNGDYYEQFPESTPGLKFVEKAIWHDKQQLVDFCGDTYPIPSNINDYLDCRYEKGWMTNIIEDAEQFFIYKRGGRKQSTWLHGRCSKHGNLWPKILKTEDSLS